MIRQNGKLRPDNRSYDYCLLDRHYRGTKADHRWLNEACGILNRAGHSYSWEWDGETYFINGFIFPCVSMACSFMVKRVEGLSNIRRF